MKPHATLFLFLIILLSCGKSTGPEITQENVKSELIRYGQENPENEVIIETKHGVMKLRLYDDTPLHRANFVKLIKEGFYDNAEFYRIIYSFVIQGGDLNKKLNYRIPAEFNPKYFHKKGALAMARTDNPEMLSSPSDFYIVHGEQYGEYDIDVRALQAGIELTSEQRETYLKQGGTIDLDQKYTVFGEVIEGFEVIDLIAKEQTNREKPLNKISMKIRLAESDK